MGQDLALWQPSTVLSPERKLEQARVMVRYSTSRLQALEQARKLMGHFPHARPPDADGYANGLADIFEQYPIGVVQQCCDVRIGIASLKDFLPSPAAVITWCDRYLGAYQGIIRRGLPKPEKHFDEKHCATMRDRVSALLPWLLKPIEHEAAE